MSVMLCSMKLRGCTLRRLKARRLFAGETLDSVVSRLIKIDGAC